ncbi:DUF4430 domain-containing protein [Pseudoflavonifractor sp. MCC625]|uniref:DUF4430 domain-containing protein n=1 Tax=Pseudoflavonifractor sp. MCC625 TaxID=2592647 RepID=UPI001C035F71|nr:DUF4430 domain-containing protein [Pseudoflavonifractor sp. MCC625]MBT9685292.1 DUF4430 domain-containing protein [Pseudoflavonifractor sp. MCC625]
MKKKQIRAIVISMLVLLLIGTAVLRINIEPVEQTPGLPAISEPLANADGPADAHSVPDTSGEKSTVPLQSDPAPETDKQEQASDSGNTTDSSPTDKPQATEPPVTTTETPPAETNSTEPPSPVTDEPEQELAPTETPALEVERHICTIEIRCDTVVDTSKLENQAVAPYVPASGVILVTTEMEFSPGESVFDVLLRATRDSNIHMEFRDDSLYSGKYIEGINYLYEMDGGPLSGWMYKVNGQFPNYGCAAYKVNDGDAIVWMYTCDLGMDVGDNSTW